MLNYAKDVLNHPSCDDLAKLGHEDLYMHLYGAQLFKGSDCKDERMPPP